MGSEQQSNMAQQSNNGEADLNAHETEKEEAAQVLSMHLFILKSD